MTLSTREVAHRLGLSGERVRALVRAGRLPATEHKHGNRRYFLFAEADVTALEATRTTRITTSYHPPFPEDTSR